ncbi:MAG: hypothetical protein PHI53_01700 [Candidatus Pacebacteria bacterium]|nr:hypothetical protein [Candidatus Paceibacterota bacterium]
MKKSANQKDIDDLLNYALKKGFVVEVNKRNSQVLVALFGPIITSVALKGFREMKGVERVVKDNSYFLSHFRDFEEPVSSRYL